MYKINKLIYIYIVISVISTAIFYSCRNTTDENYMIDDKSFPKTELLEIDEFCPIELLDTRGLIISDSYIVVYSRNEEKMIKVFDRKTNAYKGSFLTKGRSRDEVLFLTQIMQKEESNGKLKLLIQSFPRYMNWLDVDSSSFLNKVVFVERNEFNTKKQKDLLINSGASYDLGNNTVLMRYNLFDKNNPTTSMVLYDIDKDCEIDRFTWIQVDKTIPNPEIMDGINIVYSGNTSISSDRRKIAQAFFNLNRITFYDFDTKKRRNLLFDKDAMNYGSTYEKMKTENFESFYRTCVGGNKYFYAVKNPSNSDGDIASIIQLFTWYGEPKYEFVVKEKIVFIDVDERTKQLYAIIDSAKDGNLKIVIYKLPV